jgi:hypothetical protein
MSDKRNTISDKEWTKLQRNAAKSNPRMFSTGKAATAARLREQEQRRHAKRS